MQPALAAVIEDFIANEGLPPGYADTVERWFLPLAEELLRRAAAQPGPLVVGISGSQGSGKSTLAQLLVLLLRELLGLRALSLSIDDFYLTRAQRQTLALEVHPLLATRGVPGTHDVDLAVTTLQALKAPGEVAVPRFDKAMDDRVAPEQWPRLAAPLDLIILEGWCLGIGPQDSRDLVEPVNELERLDDPQGVWRTYVNERMANDYPRLYALVDYLVMLKAPNFEKVYEWRQRQEDKLAERLQDVSGTRIMTPAQVQRFIQHYERVTRQGLRTLPAQADVVFELTGAQTIKGRL